MTDQPTATAAQPDTHQPDPIVRAQMVRALYDNLLDLAAGDGPQTASVIVDLMHYADSLADADGYGAAGVIDLAAYHYAEDLARARQEPPSV